MDTLEELKKMIIVKLNIDESEITPEARFTHDLGADSLDAVDLLIDCEVLFNIHIPDEEIENIETIQDAIDVIDSIKIANC